jgi:uncharacterized Ntn-hydrolase superfamily protein
MEAPGSSPQTSVDELVTDDPVAAQRQVLAIDARGQTGAWTGAGCLPANAHAQGDGVVAGGNTLADPGIPARMVAAFDGASGGLADRLVVALEAAEELGGDLRGVMSAAVRVVGPEPVPFSQDGTLVDVRVDHAEDPHAELRRLLRLADGHKVLVNRVLSAGRLVGTGRPAVETLDPELLDAELERAQVQLGRDGAEVAFWRGVVALRHGRTGLARELLRVAIAARPEYHELLIGAGRVGRADVPAGLLAELAPR